MAAKGNIAEFAMTNDSPDLNVAGSLRQKLADRHKLQFVEGRAKDLVGPSFVQDARPSPLELSIHQDKCWLKKYYNVSVRTLETWLSTKIIVGLRSGRKLRFNIKDCDQRLLGHRLNNEKYTTMETLNPNQLCSRHWTTKKKLAEHYGVSLRTISYWMSLNILVFFKIKRVVRFDVSACDAVLNERHSI